MHVTIGNTDMVIVEQTRQRNIHSIKHSFQHSETFKKKLNMRIDESFSQSSIPSRYCETDMHIG